MSPGAQSSTLAPHSVIEEGQLGQRSWVLSLWRGEKAVTTIVTADASAAPYISSFPRSRLASAESLLPHAQEPFSAGRAQHQEQGVSLLISLQGHAL